MYSSACTRLAGGRLRICARANSTDLIITRISWMQALCHLISRPPLQPPLSWECAFLLFAVTVSQEHDLLAASISKLVSIRRRSNVKAIRRHLAPTWKNSLHGVERN